ncbi:MAG: methyl-accepting chemotaxis protein [Rhodoferax sp.]|uniref:methyl-accepting chemotaxis protein n=1 Tax=Rhodoferax sp. TaxID=50421 RepID=UPI0027333040|nr:methyl-accepting chemotaxis protein [Rhodoferax sp.]MDP2680883.1 methyl-accepting chemotaxis protein [Rhodoferax sp.]
MKGMMDFLEKAGLVKRDFPNGVPENENSSSATEVSEPIPNTTNAPTAVATPVEPGVGTSSTLNLDSIYGHHGVGPSLYPAERLLRLIDGLSAMDETTRQMAIKAMDAADESWTIEDPLNDAAAKILALAEYSSSMAENLRQLEIQTQAHLDAVTSRQEQVVGDIRKQIVELEGLVTRELSRSAQEIAAQEANINAARDQIARDLTEVGQVSQRLQSLSSQFGASKTTIQE